MKNFIYLLLLCSLVLGCKVPKFPMTHTDSAPYIQLKDGKNISVPSVKLAFKFFRGEKIVGGGKEYKPRDVLYFSSGKKNYARVPKTRNKFAMQVASGPVNVFRYQKRESTGPTPGGGGGMGASGHTGRTHIASYYYLQQELNMPLKTMSYSKLRELIPSGGPGSKELDRYRGIRRATRVLGYTSLGLLGGAVALISSGSVLAIAGGGMLVAFFPTYFTYGIMRAKNSFNLIRAVNEADKNALNAKMNPKVKHKRFHDPLLEEFNP